MNKTEKVIRIAAILTIWTLMLLGILVLIAVPFGTAALVNQYSEYKNDFGVIVGMLFAPVVLAEALLGVILVLLRRIRVDQMFSVSAHRWVRGLAYIAAALSASFVVLLIWLNVKNTLPPAIGLILLVSFFVPLAVALVTRTLLVLLKQATAKSIELEGVV